MSRELIQAAAELDRGEMAGKALAIATKHRLGDADVLVSVSRRALRRLWNDCPTLYLWVSMHADVVRIEGIGAVDPRDTPPDGTLIVGG